MSHVAYLATIVVALCGVCLIDRRLGLPLRQLTRTVLVTVPLFLAFDLLGAARGWFASNPSLNVLIVKPGIPLEEPLLLTFLALLSVTLWAAARRVSS